MFEDYLEFTNAEKALNNWVISELSSESKFVNKCVQQSLFDTHIKEAECLINWGSSKQVIPLFEYLGFNLSVLDKKTKQLKKSVDAKVIKPQKELSPVAPLYLTYKKWEKVCNTYGQNFIDAINPVSRRIHTNFTQLMDTSRLSSGGGKDKDTGYSIPNLQNIPSDAATRSCFISEGGNSWVSVDYCGQESVLIANVANDSEMIEEFLHGSGDMHSLVAKAIYPDELESVEVKDIKKLYPHLRNAAKGPEFLFNYGGNDMTLVTTYGYDPIKAKETYNSYLNKFKGVANYQKQCRKEVMELGYIEHSPEYGHKTFVYDFEELQNYKRTMNTPGFWDKYKAAKAAEEYTYEIQVAKQYFKRRSELEKQSINYRIQGRGAVCFKRASIAFYK